MQKSIFIITLICGLFAFSAFQIQNGTPKMILSTLTVDYGKIEYNAYPYRTVTVKNIGDAPLILQNIKVSGGGLSPASYPKKPILPKATGEISFRYNTRRRGLFNKSITVISNAGRKIIRVKGYVMDTIQPQIQADSNSINYGVILQKSNPYRIFTFKNTGQKELIIKQTKCGYGCLVTIEKTHILPDSTGSIKVQYDTQRLGIINRLVQIETNNEQKPYYNIPVKGEVIEITDNKD